MPKRKMLFCLIETTYSSGSSDSDESNNSRVETSSSTTSTNSLDSDNEDDGLFFPLMKYLLLGQRRHRINNYLEIVESWTEQEFKEHLRLSRKTAMKLIDELEASKFIPNHSYGTKPITSKLTFLIFLWYMANTEPLRTISDRFDVSISSVFRVIRRAISWLLSKSEDVIKWPEHDNIIPVKEQFFLKRGIPNVLGAIDCTHIRIEKPAVNERDYCNRKKYFSIHLQAIVDSSMRFTNIYCGEPGSLHDARVLRRSPLYQLASEEKDTLFPQETFLIGDSAYPSLSWLVPPFRDNGHLTPQQTEFNFLLSSTRIVIERAFGYLKQRFRRIKFFTEYKDTSFVINTVVAACILHNYCITENDDFHDHVDEEYENVNNNNLPGNIDNEIQEDRRMQLFREMYPQV